MQTIPKQPNPTPTAAGKSGFQSIPTRIRDIRDTPPLVVQPVPEEVKQQVASSLDELGQKLAGIHRTAAEAWIAQGEYARALPHLDAAATFAPGELEYHNQLGFVRYLTGDDVGAINAFNSVLSGDSRNAEAWFNLGMVLFGQGQFAEAEGCFGRSIEIRGDDSQAWNNRGVCLFQIGRKADARGCFESALRIDPNDQDARVNLQNV